MEKGTLVEFQVKGSPRLGVVDRPEGKKNWIVLDDRGQSHAIHPRELTFQFVGEGFVPGDLASLQREAESYIDPSSLQVAWEILHEAGESVDPATLSLLLFSEQSVAFCYAAHRLLVEDKIFFKQKGDRYEPRPPAQVKELLYQIEKEAQRQAEWEGFLRRARQILVEESVEWQKSDRPRLETLEKYALLGEESNQLALAQEILSALQRPTTAEAAFELLVALKIWDVHENLALRNSQIPLTFPEAVLAMAQSRLHNPPPDPDAHRLDLTALKTYTIDDESTCEIDDALSVETLPDGRQRLWVHIADPSRWVTPGDDLDLEARRRCTTVYLPTGIIPMFPMELASGPMSLVQGETRCALSFGVVLTAEGAIADYDIAASQVKPTYRLTYEDVDEMLDLGIQGEPELMAIARWAKIRRQWRTHQGAINIHIPESSIKVSKDDGAAIDIKVLDDSPARELVAEMMILAGEVAARYGQDHNLAIPFRSQPQPDLPSEEELMQLPSPLVRYSAIRRCMPRSEMGVTPARHATLGLAGYSQVTSPIRRYTDLLAHFQIKAHLRGEPLPFSSEEITELTQGASSGAYEAVLVERQTKRYWALEYLRREGERLWTVILLRWLRESERFGLVLFEELGLELAMRFERDVPLGERLHVKVTHANPRQDIIRMEEVDAAEGEAAAFAEIPSAVTN